MSFLLLELIVADLPPVVASIGQEWQYEFSTVRAHSGRSTPHIYFMQASWDVYYGMCLAAIVDS